MSHHIASDRYRRVGAAMHNFPATLPPEESDLAREIVADPYDLEFLRLGPGYSEREFEDALVERLTNFITELGAGFHLLAVNIRYQSAGKIFILTYYSSISGYAVLSYLSSKPVALSQNIWANSTFMSTLLMICFGVPNMMTVQRLVFY